MRPSSCALIQAGSSPGRNPLRPPLRGRLERHGIELTTWDPTAPWAVPPDAPPADLYLVKGDDPLILSAAGCLADAGAPCLNTFEATAAAADKARSLTRLARAGLPVPITTVAGDRESLARALETGPRFVKPVRGAHGEGAQQLLPGGASTAGPGPWLVQEALQGPGYDLKVYGVGERVATRKVRSAGSAFDAPREHVPRLPPEILTTARAAAEISGLTCFGVDFVVTAEGPRIVDVNAFPGYRGVDQAPAWVADATLAELRKQP